MMKPVQKTRKPPKTLKPTKGKGNYGSVLSRPQTELDMTILANCAKIQCTVTEAAAVCQVSVDTIERRLKKIGLTWAQFYEEHSASGKASLRRAMFKAALEENNVTAQIWLSKQHLGMKDKTEFAGDPLNPMIHKIVREIVDVTPND